VIDDQITRLSNYSMDCPMDCPIHASFRPASSSPAGRRQLARVRMTSILVRACRCPRMAPPESGSSTLAAESPADDGAGAVRSGPCRSTSDDPVDDLSGRQRDAELSVDQFSFQLVTSSPMLFRRSRRPARSKTMSLVDGLMYFRG